MTYKEAAKLRWQNPEYRKHMSEVHKGKSSWMAGRHHTKKTRIKISQKNIGRPGWSKGQKLPQFSGKNACHWKGGIRNIKFGHIMIYSPNHPFCDKNKCMRRNRLVMEKILGRYLSSNEVVHHKGIKYPINSIENKQDDRPENLQLFVNTNEHSRFHAKFRVKKGVRGFI